MKLKMLRGLWAVLAMVGCTVCGGPGYEVRTLSSGKALRVLGVQKVNLPDGGPTLILQYQTDIKKDDQEALRKEAREIWADFKADVESANLGNAILSANFATQGSSSLEDQIYNFVYVKDSSGAWRCSNDQ